MSSVLLVDGEAVFSLPLSCCLSAANRTVHVGSATRFPDIRYSRFCKAFRWWSDRSQLLENARTFAAEHRIAVILACSDAGIRFVSEHRRELEIVARVAGTPTIEALDTTIDKAAFAHFLSQTALPHPETIAVEAGQLPRRIPRFPAVLKPALGGGGELITYFEHPDEWELFTANGGLGTRRWVLQSYVRGRDIGCSVICRAGKILAHTIQGSLEPAQTSFSPSGGIEFIHDDGVLSLAAQLLGALDWTGVANIDMREDPDGRVFLLELNGRYWATMLGSYRAGVNFPELACLDALGREVPRAAYRNIRFFTRSSQTGWRGKRLAETTLPWRLSDPGPVVAAWLKSRWRRRPSCAAGF